MKDEPSSLDRISEGIREAGRRREQERQALNEARGDPNLFIPDEDQENRDKGFGMGYWVHRELGRIEAVRRMANGFERYPCAQYDIGFLRLLIKLYDEVGG